MLLLTDFDTGSCYAAQAQKATLLIRREGVRGLPDLNMAAGLPGRTQNPRRGSIPWAMNEKIF